MNTAKNVKLDRASVIILVTQLCIHAILIVLCLLYEPLNYQPDALIYPSCCFLLCLTIWVFGSWYILTKSLFSPYILFFISALLFNGGQAILEIFNLNEEGILGNKFSSETIFKTLLIIILSLASFHLGALISAAKKKVTCFKLRHEKEHLSISRDTYLIGWRLIAISSLPALVVLQKAISIVLSAGYFGLYEQDSSTSFDAAPTIIAEFLIPATLFLLAGSKDKPRDQVISVVIVIAYSAIKFFTGQRNEAIMPLIAFAWLWHHTIRPFPPTFLLGSGSVILFILIPLIGASRNSKDRFSVDFLIETFSSHNPAIAAISEMGGSMMTVAHTIELVPSVRNFQMGAEYFYALLTLMPNLFWKVHPTVARGIPDKWLVWEVDTEFAARGGSFGFSFIAEAYLNFGWFGAPIALGMMGLIFAKFTLWAVRSGSPARMATVASFTSFILFFPRAESALMVRSLVWYSLLPYLSVCLLGWLRSKKLRG